jgi:hypothetical protein
VTGVVGGAGHPAGGEQQVESRIVQHPGQPGERVRIPGLADVVDEHADRPAAALAERPGRPVGQITELLDGRLDRPATFLADP